MSRLLPTAPCIFCIVLIVERTWGRTLDLKITGTNAVYSYHCMGCGGAKGKYKWWSSHKVKEEGTGRRTSPGTIKAVAAACLAPISYNVWFYHICPRGGILWSCTTCVCSTRVERVCVVQVHVYYVYV